MEGYTAIAEHELTTCVWIAFATPKQLWRKTVWGSLVDGVKDDLKRIAQAIASFCPVKVLVPPGREVIEKNEKMVKYGGSHAESAHRVFGDEVTYQQIPLDDLWIRDTGPIFVRDGFGQIHGVDSNFNGWGFEQPHCRDARVAQRLLASIGLPRVDTWLRMEGGALEFDGAGTVMITDCSILNENRNPGSNEEGPVRSKTDTEAELARLFGVTKIIWLQGPAEPAMRDITDGHVDFYARFVEPGHVVVHSDRHGKEREITDQIARTLKRETDARGHPLEVTTIEGPSRRRSKYFAASYLNFLIAGNAVIAQAFGEKSDRAARERLSALFPGREIELIKVNSLAAGGGGVHCATLNQPQAQNQSVPKHPMQKIESMVSPLLRPGPRFPLPTTD